MTREVPDEFHPAAVFGRVSESELFDAEGACPTLVEPGSLDRVWVISGENAGGKSILTRAVQQIVHHGTKDAGVPVEVMRVGMDLRTESSVMRGMMFGSERDGSTGNNSVRTMFSGMNTARNRQHAHWLVFDEPDVGVGEGYRHAMGQAIAGFCADMPALTQALVVVTHSREIVAPLAAAGASCVRVGDDLRPTAEWLRDGDLPKTVEDLEALSAKALGRFRAIGRLLDERNRDRDGQRGPRP